jgi:Ca2+-binding EF-hand superfamily protein
MSGISGLGGGGFTPAAIKHFAQNLFSQIDLSGDGSVSKAELEQAVTKDGGNTTAADALYSVLDPNNAGGFGEQQLAHVLPGSGFSDQMQAQMIGYQAQGWPGASGAGASGPQPGSQLAQSLFSQIDGNGDGSISQSELEQAVTKAGGTKEGADALYAKLDPNGTGSVSEQQFSSSLTQAMPHHHHHHHDGGDQAASATDNGNAGGGAADALTSLFNADGGGAGNSPTQIAQNMFAQSDLNGDGAITQSELEQAVTKAGGSKSGADALYAKLDPNGTGSVSQQQFIDALQPPSASGNTAQDALLALLDPVSQSNAVPPAASATGTGAAGTGIAGNTAQDAVSALVQSYNPTASSAAGSGNSARDALMSLIKGSDSTSSGPAGTTPAGLFSSADWAHAFALYQSQLEQQLVSGTSATQSASI